MLRLRVMLLGSGLFLLALLSSAPSPVAVAQVANPADQSSADVAIGLPVVDRALERRLNNAKELITNGKQESAVAQIQSILDLQQDGLYQPADEVAGRWISLKQQAESILGKAAPETLRAYELRYGTKARTLLEQAVEQRNPALAEEVMRRFLYTNAGADAAYWLGSFHQDRADYDTALQSFTRLIRLHATSRFEPQLSLRMGLCLYRTGRVDKAVAMIRSASAAIKTPLKLGGQELPARAADPQVLAWLKATSPGQVQISEPKGWLMARGNAERNMLFRSSPPLGKSLWKTSLLDWTVPSYQVAGNESELDFKPQITALSIINSDKGLSPLPAATPLLVNDVIVARFFDHLAGFDLRTGEELWRSAETDLVFHFLLKHLHDKEPNVVSLRAKSTLELFNLLLRQRTWEDLTFGTLSSDGDYVFSIEDLGFLNDIHVPPTLGAVSQINSPLAMKDSNRLRAYEAKTGKLKWELGGPRGEIALPLAGTFFLGPPLAVDRRLMCLVENQGLIRLVILDSRSGKVLRTQILSQATETLTREPTRRRAGLTPVLLGDLLVCPTGDGMVVTVDLASRTHIWAYQYSDSRASNGRDPKLAVRMQMLRGYPNVEMDVMRGAEVNEWQDGGPIIAEGHVLLTPRDSAELHCLSLEDGKVAWRVPRREGLYVAAVQSGLVIVVGSRSVEALRLEDGKQAWPAPVPLLNQAGRGIVTEGQILLPLVTGDVATVDLKSGHLLARSKIHESQLLGNLIPGQGFIISQSASNLAVFRTLDSIVVETAARLKQNPQDAEALALRGEYRLSQGDLDAGRDDLRRSLKLRESPDTQSVLFDSLLQGLQADFAGHRAALGELEQLAETSAQRAVLYRAWSEGLLGAKQYAQAFQVLLKLSEADLGKPTLDRLDGYRSMRRDHWIQTQIHQLMQTVDDSTRTGIDAEIRLRISAALARKNVDELRNVIRHFGSHPLANDVRLGLAELLMASEYSTEVEQLLAYLSHHASPPLAGRALALMIRETIKINHADECAVLLERLAREFADVACLDNQTGRQLAEAWLPKVQAQTMSLADWPAGKIEVSRETSPMRGLKWSFDVAMDGDPGPFFRDAQFIATNDDNRVIGMNGSGTFQWAIPWSETGGTSNFTAYRAQARNHVVFLTMGRQVCAVSTLMPHGGVRAHAMWISPLVEGSVGDENQFMVIPVNRAGMLRPQMARVDFHQNPLGVVASIEDDTVVIQRGRHLILADLLTGNPLWKRTDLVPGSEIFGDSEVIVVVPPDKPAGQIIRRLDGVTLRESVAVAPTSFRIISRQRQMLSYGRDAKQKTLRLRYDDVPDQKLLWAKEFELTSNLAVVSQDEIAVLQPGAGTLSLIRISDGTLLWEEKLTIAQNLRDLWIVPNGDRLLVINGEIPARQMNRPAMMIVGQSNQIVVDGQVESLDRATGKSQWSHKVEGMALDYTMPKNLPCWIFSILSATAQPGKPPTSEFQTMAIDKRNGQIILQTKDTNNISKMQVGISPSDKVVRINLFGATETITHKLKFTNEPVESPGNPAPNP